MICLSSVEFLLEINLAFGAGGVSGLKDCFEVFSIFLSMIIFSLGEDSILILGTIDKVCTGFSVVLGNLVVVETVLATSTVLL